MKYLLILPLIIAGCTSANDVAIQTAYANARSQECVAVANIAQAGAASEAAVLMAARGCGSGPAPQTGADRMIQLAGALSPLASAAINGAVAVKQGQMSAETQREQIAASTAAAGIEAGVLTELGRDQVVEVRPEVVNPEVIQAPDPVIVNNPAPEVVQLPAPEVVQLPAPAAPKICSTNAEGILVCQ